MKLPKNTLDHTKIGDCTLVLYNWSSLSETSSPRVWENVEFFDENGRKLWTVNGMNDCPYWDNNIDMFVGFRNDGKSWFLTSSGGNAYILDVQSGLVIYKSFHK